MSVTHIRGTLRVITSHPQPYPTISWHTNLHSCTNPHAGILSDSCTAAPRGRGVITPSICSWLALDVERHRRAEPRPHEGTAKRGRTNKVEISIRGIRGVFSHFEAVYSLPTAWKRKSGEKRSAATGIGVKWAKEHSRDDCCEEQRVLNQAQQVSANRKKLPLERKHKCHR